MGEVQERISGLSLSPDGRRVAFQVPRQGNRDIYVHDLERNISTWLTYDPAVDQSPIWSPDGRWVVFTSFRSGGGDIYVRASDGSGSAGLLVSGPGRNFPNDWSLDGRFLIYSNRPDSTGVSDLWYTTLQYDIT